MPKETMTARERWLAVLRRETPDRIPMDYWTTAEAHQKLLNHLKCINELVLRSIIVYNAGTSLLSSDEDRFYTFEKPPGSEICRAGPMRVKKIHLANLIVGKVSFTPGRSVIQLRYYVA